MKRSVKRLPFTLICTELFSFTFSDANCDGTDNIIDKHLHRRNCFQPASAVDHAYLSTNIIKYLGSRVEAGTILLTEGTPSAIEWFQTKVQSAGCRLLTVETWKSEG